MAGTNAHLLSSIYVASSFEDVLLTGNFRDNKRLKLGTAIGLNMTHNASFYADSVNTAAWKRVRSCI